LALGACLGFRERISDAGMREGFGTMQSLGKLSGNAVNGVGSPEARVVGVWFFFLLLAWG